jgi:mRNA interferase YafQ
MVSKKPPEAKRAKLPRKSDFTKGFVKDWKRYDESGRFPMNDLKTLMGLLVANDGPLPKHYRDHELSGKKWQGSRECHIHGDFLLVYEVKDDDETIIFVAIGTHSELFGR